MNVTAQTLATDQGSTERDYLIEGLAKLADATPVRIKR